MKEQTNTQLLQIKEQMELLAKQATSIKNRIDISEQIYNAEIRFEPLISHTYHLYKKNEEDYFLSMISPTDWGKNKSLFTFIASVKLLSDQIYINLY